MRALSTMLWSLIQVPPPGQVSWAVRGRLWRRLMLKLDNSHAKKREATIFS